MFESERQIQASYVLESIVSLSIKYSIPLITLNCPNLLELILSDDIYPLSNSRILECVFNRLQVTELTSKKVQLFLNGDVGKNIAAKTIQYYYYRHRTRWILSFKASELIFNICRVQRKQDELTFRAKRRICAFYLRYKSKKSYLKTFKEKMMFDRQTFMQLQNSFLREGASLYAKRRVLIFLCPPNEKNLFER